MGLFSKTVKMKRVKLHLIDKDSGEDVWETAEIRAEVTDEELADFAAKQGKIIEMPVQVLDRFDTKEISETGTTLGSVLGAWMMGGFDD